MARTVAVKQTAPHRRVERKSDKSKRRNRNKSQNRKKRKNNRNKKANCSRRNPSNALTQQTPTLRNRKGKNSCEQPMKSRSESFNVSTFSRASPIDLALNAPTSSNRRRPQTSFKQPPTRSSPRNSNSTSLVQARSEPDLISRVLFDNPNCEIFSLENLSQMSRLQRSFGTASLFVLADAVIQFMLTFLPLFDLFGNVHCVCTPLQKMTSIDNSYIVKNLTCQITSEKECEKRTWTCDSKLDSCKKMVLFVAKTYQYGKELNQWASETKRHGRAEERLVLRCVRSVFGHLSGIVKVVYKPGLHEIIMSSRLGMDRLSGEYLQVYLSSKGMEEDEMTEKKREIVRMDYLVYQEQFLHDGFKIISEDSLEYFEKEMDDFDFESAEHMTEESSDADDDVVFSGDRQYPVCGIVASSADTHREVDPLSLLTFMGSGEMARRIVRLFMDFENGVPPESIQQCRDVVFFYLESIMFNCGSRDDVETVQFIISNLWAGDSQFCLFLLGFFIIPNEKEMLVCYARRMIDIQGFHVKFDYDQWVTNRIEFAEQMIPFLMSCIRLEELDPEHVATLIQFVQSKTNPETKLAGLMTLAQDLLLPFVSDFI